MNHMKTIATKILLLSTVILLSIDLTYAQSECADDANIFHFTYDNKSYQVIKENKTWEEAAACALERGGFLAEINNQAEQDTIFASLKSSECNIDLNQTISSDGGDRAYVWIGGNDLKTEGTWIWDGDNDESGTQFWSGKGTIPTGGPTGSPVGGLYNNFYSNTLLGGAMEPDDFGSAQDALAIALNASTMFHEEGEWNDLDETNQLYYIVEYSEVLSASDLEFMGKVKLYPNIVGDYLTVEINKDFSLKSISVLNSLGQEIKTFETNDNSKYQILNFSTLDNGVYFVKIVSDKDQMMIRKIIK